MTITIRHEQNPGLLSDCERAASAGLRKLWSPLSELESSEYIAGRSEAESAMISSCIELYYFNFFFMRLQLHTKRTNRERWKWTWGQGLLDGWRLRRCENVEVLGKWLIGNGGGVREIRIWRRGFSRCQVLMPNDVNSPFLSLSPGLIYASSRVQRERQRKREILWASTVNPFTGLGKICTGLKWSGFRCAQTSNLVWVLTFLSQTFP